MNIAGKQKALSTGCENSGSFRHKNRSRTVRVWQKQEQQHKRIDSDIGEIRSKVEAIIESEVPSVAIRPVKRRKKPPLTEAVATP